MTFEETSRCARAALAIAALALVLPLSLLAQQAPAAVIDADDIGGMVRGPKGPEAGVWVIAETTSFPPSSPESWSPMGAAAVSFQTSPRLRSALRLARVRHRCRSWIRRRTR